MKRIKPNQVSKKAAKMILVALLKMNGRHIRKTLAACGIEYNQEEGEFWLGVHHARLDWPGMPLAEQRRSAAYINFYLERSGSTTRVGNIDGEWEFLHEPDQET